MRPSLPKAIRAFLERCRPTVCLDCRPQEYASNAVIVVFTKGVLLIE